MKIVKSDKNKKKEDVAKYAGDAGAKYSVSIMVIKNNLDIKITDMLKKITSSKYSLLINE